MGIEERVAEVDWAGVEESLAARGHADAGHVLDARECRGLGRLWADDDRFRKTVDLARQRFGDRGAYRYFARPLPEPVERLRRALYPPLARIANRWQAAFGRDERFPAGLPAFLRRCAAAGQERPTPLLLRYDPGGYNCLHQDRYGAVAFPLQVVILLCDPARDFEGGEFLLVEQRPRMQSRGTAIPLRRGHALVFPNAERPVGGTRGVYAVQVRHGVSELLAGTRTTLGIIFHDAD